MIASRRADASPQRQSGQLTSPPDHSAPKGTAGRREQRSCDKNSDVSPTSRGRAYWAVTEVRGRRQARVVWAGQKCPSCRGGRLELFVPPEESEAGLVCDHRECIFGMWVQPSSPEPPARSILRWTDIPLENHMVS